MNLRKRIISLLLTLSIVLSGCENFSIPTNANTAFRNFTLGLFQQEVSSNAINLHYTLQEPEKYGITQFPITFGSYDMNSVSALASIENWEAALQKFPYQSLSKENQLTYDILSYYFSSARKDVTYYLYEEPLSPLTGIHAQLPVLLAEYQFVQKADVETYLSLLETLPDFFSSLIRFQQQKLAAGLFMSDDAVDSVVEQCNAFIEMGENNYLLSTFKERLETMKKLTDKELEDLIQKNKLAFDTYVIPSYQSLASSLAKLKTGKTDSLGLCQFPEGKECYAHIVSRETGSNRSVAELKTLIQNQISADLQDIQDLLTNHPFIAEDAAQISKAPETILETLKQKTASNFPTSATVNVNIKYVPTALQEHLSPAFYLIPAIDQFKENTIYINERYSLDDISLFTTLAHEGYPGHLYQTTYFANTNPDPIRLTMNFLGYVEGWATYAEMCSYYISPLSKPYASLLQKNNSMVLGLYAFADIGIHYDGWTIKDTISFFQKYGFTDEASIEDIYTHIANDPANYLAYYVGYLEMLEMKKEVIKREGENFSQKQFHQKLLEIGPAPFEIVRKYL